MDLPQSKLGTKAYWDAFYAREIENFSNNAEDTGECWFDDSGAEQRMCDFLESAAVDPAAEIIDLGTGNGHLLFALRDAGVPGNMLGVDYSEVSVEFARRIAVNAGYDVAFKQCDFVSEPDWTTRRFDYVLDKGTLDAIALSSVPDAAQKYRRSVLRLLKPAAQLIITSCNFTEQELAGLIDLPYTKLPYPEFTFGGVKGSSVVTLIFTRTA